MSEQSEQKEFFIPPGYNAAESECPNVSVPSYSSLPRSFWIYSISSS